MARINIDTEKREELREDFAYLDQDQDGRLQYDEFVSFLTDLDPGVTPEQAQIDFEEIDSDHDGTIGFDEFLEWWMAS